MKKRRIMENPLILPIEIWECILEYVSTQYFFQIKGMCKSFLLFYATRTSNTYKVVFKISKYAFNDYMSILMKVLPIYDNIFKIRRIDISGINFENIKDYKEQLIYLQKFNFLQDLVEFSFPKNTKQSAMNAFLCTKKILHTISITKSTVSIRWLLTLPKNITCLQLDNLCIKNIKNPNTYILSPRNIKIYGKGITSNTTINHIEIIDDMEFMKYNELFLYTIKLSKLAVFIRHIFSMHVVEETLLYRQNIKMQYQQQIKERIIIDSLVDLKFLIMTESETLRPLEITAYENKDNGPILAKKMADMMSQSMKIIISDLKSLKYISS